MNKPDHSEIKRGWFYLNSENKLDSTDFNIFKELEYKGLKETLILIRKIAEENDILGIFSFSQGSLLNVILGILIESEEEYKNLFCNLKCFIICSGFFNPLPINEELKNNYELFKEIFLEENNKGEKFKIKIPMLNIYGEEDDIITKDKSIRIEEIYSSVLRLNHPGKHFIPSAMLNYDVHLK